MLSFVCIFSWKENMCDTILKHKILGFMGNNKFLIRIEDLEDQKWSSSATLSGCNIYLCDKHQVLGNDIKYSC